MTSDTLVIEVDLSKSPVLKYLAQQHRTTRNNGWVSVGELMRECKLSMSEAINQLKASYQQCQLEYIAGNGMIFNRYRINPQVKFSAVKKKVKVLGIKLHSEMQAPDDETEGASEATTEVPAITAAQAKAVQQVPLDVVDEVKEGKKITPQKRAPKVSAPIKPAKDAQLRGQKVVKSSPAKKKLLTTQQAPKQKPNSKQSPSKATKPVQKLATKKR